MSSMVSGPITTIDTVARTCTVEGLDGTVLMMRHVTAGVGDIGVVALASGQMWLLGVLGATTPPAPPEEEGPQPLPPGPAPVVPETLVLRPVWSGTWRSSAWRSDTSDLYQGDWTGRGVNTGGCWWGTLPAGVVSASVQLRRISGAGAGAPIAPTMALLAGTSRPAGAPSILATIPGPMLSRTASTATPWALPSAWVGQLAAGTAGGIGCTSAGSREPYLGLTVSGVGMTLALTITAT